MLTIAMTISLSLGWRWGTDPSYMVTCVIEILPLSCSLLTDVQSRCHGDKTSVMYTCYYGNKHIVVMTTLNVHLSSIRLFKS